MSDFVQIFHAIGLTMCLVGIVMRIYDWRFADTRNGK